MKKISFVLLALVCAIFVNAKVIYLVPNDWRSDGAALFVHSWGGGSFLYYAHNDSIGVLGSIFQEDELACIAIIYRLGGHHHRIRLSPIVGIIGI